jgi:hypothetical protein
VIFCSLCEFSNSCHVLRGAVVSITRRMLLAHHIKSRDSSVGVALGYGLDDRGSRFRFPAGSGNFSLHHRVQTGSEAHPASYRMGTGGSFRGDKEVGVWSWPLTSIWCRDQRMSGAIPPLPQYNFMAGCSVTKKTQGTSSPLPFTSSPKQPYFVCLNWVRGGI